MKIGICTHSGNLEAAQRAGFEYIEVNLSALAALSPQQFETELGVLSGTGIPSECSIRPECCNVFFPPDIRLLGDAADQNRAREYISASLERAGRLGVQIAVVGSGAARRVPEGMSMQAAEEQFCGILTLIGDTAKQYGITAVVEPLNYDETNLINTVAQGARICRLVNHSHVKLLVDFYHFRLNNENVQSIVDAGNLIRHLHIANSHGRLYPSAPDEDEYAAFFAALKTIGYSGRISVEASCGDFGRDSAAAIRLIQHFIKG